MFRLFKRTSTYNPIELLDSRLYNENSFYDAFANDLKYASQSVIIESPFIAVRRTQALYQLFENTIGRGVNIRINTRHPKYHDPELREQAWQSVELLKQLGVTIRLYDDQRHRKIAIIDDMLLWEGSLNIMSQSNSKEIMRRIQSKVLAQQMVEFCELKSWK